MPEPVRPIEYERTPPPGNHALRYVIGAAAATLGALRSFGALWPGGGVWVVRNWWELAALPMGIIMLLGGLLLLARAAPGLAVWCVRIGAGLYIAVHLVAMGVWIASMSRGANYPPWPLVFTSYLQSLILPCLLLALTLRPFRDLMFPPRDRA